MLSVVIYGTRQYCCIGIVAEVGINSESELNIPVWISIYNLILPICYLIVGSGRLYLTLTKLARAHTGVRFWIDVKDMQLIRFRNVVYSIITMCVQVYLAIIIETILWERCLNEHLNEFGFCLCFFLVSRSHEPPQNAGKSMPNVSIAFRLRSGKGKGFFGFGWRSESRARLDHTLYISFRSHSAVRVSPT